MIGGGAVGSELGQMLARFGSKVTVVDILDEAEVDERGLLFRVRLELRGRWGTCIRVVPAAEDVCVVKYGHGETRAKPNMPKSLDGLARYGYREEAARSASALFEAAVYFRYRLPEVFAGYSRALTRFPVEYPTASSPQAWATAAPLLLLRALLGLEPGDDGLATDPFLPDGISRLELRGVPGRWGRADAAAEPIGRRRAVPFAASR